MQRAYARDGFIGLGKPFTSQRIVWIRTLEYVYLYARYYTFTERSRKTPARQVFDALQIALLVTFFIQK